MLLPSLTELQPYFSLIGAVLSIATLGFVINLAKLMRDAAKERAEVMQERLRGVQDDLERTEKWSEREKEALTAENQELKKQLQDILAKSNLDLQSLIAGHSIQDLRTQEVLNDLINKIENQEQSSGQIQNPEWHLELAKGYMAKKDWNKAALHFDQYVLLNPLDPEIQRARGVAHANSRGGRDSNINALRAYNEAIALAPTTIDTDKRAQIYSYRGAMFKRLGRLDEAEADLRLAKNLSTRDSETRDINYNLAGIYALQGKRPEMMKMVHSLRGCQRELTLIQKHRHDYFKNFAQDKEFLKAIES